MSNVLRPFPAKCALLILRSHRARVTLYSVKIGRNPALNPDKGISLRHL